ncbi:LysE family transporter [Agromyces sp. ISL-38]|uniref:LysE family translocator n=1 Tax=Agromyces sp. ISL-38 TaxID=2819107 RepID=UPI001BE8D34C|nr:LysE family transporter [Agromyces sp. ISL-38]MBT2498362.1 LysE family transporter [Agromyces sp. ISL-38]
MNGIPEAIGAYAIAAALLTMLPGPDTAIVLVTAINAGRAAAVRAALGIGVGLLMWGTAAGLGLAAMLRASAEVYTVFKFACAAYLLWLGFTSLRAALRRRRNGAAAHDEVDVKRRLRLPWGFRQALLTAMLNPKLGVFFVAFLPQFIPPGTSAFGMTMLFSAIQATEAIIWFLVIGSLAGMARSWLSRPRVRRAMAGVTGTIFVFFAARVATE